MHGISGCMEACARAQPPQKHRALPLCRTRGSPTNLYPVLGLNLRKHFACVVEFAAHRFVVALLQGTNLGI